MTTQIEDVQLSAMPATKSPRQSLVRVLAALLLTVTLLPYAWGFTLITSMITNWTLAPSPQYIIFLVGGLGAIMWLTYHQAENFSPRFNRNLIIGLLVVWLAVNGAIVFMSNGPKMSVVYALAGYLPATLWLPCIGWMLYSRIGWGKWVGMFAVCLIGLAAFLSIFRIEDSMGADQVNFAFAWDERKSDFDTSVAAGSAAVTAESLSIKPTDSPQYMGPERTGVITSVRLNRDWKNKPPREVWRKPVGSGWSSFATIGNLAITQEQREKNESVVCYDITNGDVLWIHEDAAFFNNSLGGDGPRATPTIDGDRVYSLGATGMLNCLDTRTGNVMWSRDILTEFKAENQAHGVCSSPLVYEDKVIVCPTGANGPSLVAYNKNNGTPLWQAGAYQASYSSPMVLDLAGSKQILIFNTRGLIAHDPATGKEVWEFPFQKGTENVHCSQPILIEGENGSQRVFLSAGYGTGSALFALEGTDASKMSVKELWNEKTMKTKFTSPVRIGDYVYGLDDGILQCTELSTGKQKWKGGRYGHGQILLVNDLLIVQTEKGDVVLVEPKPEKLFELAKIPALNDKTWNQPVLAGKYLLVRNDREAICFEVALEGEGALASVITAP